MLNTVLLPEIRFGKFM